MIEITTVLLGCGYVDISWNVTDSIDEKCIVSYNVTLSYVGKDKNVTVFMMTTLNSSTFSEIPYDTPLSITVFSINIYRDVFSFDSTSVRTIGFESMCKFMSCYILHY